MAAGAEGLDASAIHNKGLDTAKTGGGGGFEPEVGKIRLLHESLTRLVRL